VRSDRLERPLRIADLPGQLVDLPAGTTFTWRGPPPEYREVEVAPRSVMRHEVTRGQWAEFLRDLEAHPERIPAWLRESLWRNAEYVRPYANRWWDLAEPVLRASSGRTEVRRPAMLEPPLSDEAGLLLLVPPSWLLLTPFDEIEWRLPDPLKGPASENLPVTEISWWDAVAFAEWASTVLSLDPPLHLPFEVEWQRAAHGDDPRRKWVWGDELLLYACNSQNFWSGGGDPAPLPVDYEYSDHPGTTSDGLWAMAGNASEWAWPDPDPDETDPPATAPRCGGSYLEGIDDCRVDSRQYDDKRQRFPDTGFRLVREPGP
jgi:formylglycine-generating enzyme required for sulfatase activity